MFSSRKITGARCFARHSFLPLLALAFLTCSTPVNCIGSTVVAWGAGKTVAKPSDGINYGQSIIPADLTNAAMIASGWSQSEALLTNSMMVFWGSNVVATPGTNVSAGNALFPATNDYQSVACGKLHSVALLTNGTVMAIGDLLYGQRDVPANLTNVVAISCGLYSSLALKSDGTLSAWGGEGAVDYGQGTVPGGISNIVAVSAGGYFNLVLKSDGTVFAWGGQNVGETNVPTGLNNVVAIAAGGWHCLALKNNGTIVAWGLNGDGQANIPANATNVVAVACGLYHSLALRSNGTVVAWGYNAYGETNVPLGLTNVVQITAGQYNSLALVGTGPPVTQALLVHPTFGTNGFSVSLPTLNGRAYQLEYRDILTDGPWQPLPLHAGTGGNLMLTDPVITSQRFYEAQRW